MCVFECVHVCVHACDVLFAHSTSFSSSSSFEYNWQRQTLKRKSHQWLLKAISPLLSNFKSINPTGCGRWSPAIEPGSVRGFCLCKGSFSLPLSPSACSLGNRWVSKLRECGLELFYMKSVTRQLMLLFGARWIKLTWLNSHAINTS